MRRCGPARITASVMLTACFAALEGCGSSEIPIAAYAKEAGGARAEVTRAWNVTVEQGPSIGLASGGSVCDGHLYLADPRQSLVHEISLDDGVRRRVFSLAEIEGPSGNPETVVADCTGNALFVADQHGVARFDLTSGAYQSRLPKPERVGPALGTSLLSNSAVILSAYTMPDRGSWLTRRPSAALSDGAIGYRVPLDGSPGEPVLTELLSEGCRAMSFDCLRLGLDRLRGGTPGWLACQSDGREVGVYSDAGALVRRIDVRSPGFLDDGRHVEAEAPVPEKSIGARPTASFMRAWHSDPSSPPSIPRSIPASGRQEGLWRLESC